MKNRPSEETINNIIAFQKHLSSIMPFDSEHHLSDLLPRYRHYESPNKSFFCNTNRDSFYISANKPEMEHFCHYFGLQFEYVISMISNISKIFDEYHLFDYDSYENSLKQFPNREDSNISVDLTVLNNYDRPSFYSADYIQQNQKIFFSSHFNFKETPTLLINIDFIVYFKHVVRLEITKPIDGNLEMRISTISTKDSIGRSRKNYKLVNEQQLYNHMKRYAYRRLRTVLLRLLKLDKNELSKNSDDLKRYITLAEINLI